MTDTHPTEDPDRGTDPAEPAELERYIPPPRRRHDFESWVDVARPVMLLAERIKNTAFVPKGLRGDEYATAAAMLTGHDLELPPLTALRVINVIEGRPSLTAEGMRALVYAAGHELEVEESTTAVCRMRARRRGSSTWTPLSWNLDMARTAGLAGKQNWRLYPRQMLQARCSAELCRLVFPDVVLGMAIAEELDGATAEGAVAPVGETVTTVRRGSARATRTPASPSPPALPGGQEPPPAAAETPLETDLDPARGQGGEGDRGGAGTVWPAPPVPPPLAAVPDMPDPAPEPMEPDLDEPEPQPDNQPEPAPTVSSPAVRNRAVEQVHIAQGIPVSAPQLKMLAVLWGMFDATDQERRAWTAALVHRDLDGTTKNLRRHEAHGLINHLSSLVRSLAAEDDPMAVNVDHAEARALLLDELDRTRDADDTDS